MATLLDSIQDKYGVDIEEERREYGWIVFVSNSPECKKGMFPPIMTLSDYDISSIGNNYSCLPNSRGGSNKRGGWQNDQYEIIGQGENVSNKRGGWKSLRA